MPHHTAIITLGGAGKIEARGREVWSVVAVTVVETAKAGTQAQLVVSP